MNPALRWILGLDESEFPAGSEASWEFAGLPAGNWLLFSFLLIVACLVLIILLYRSENTLGSWQKAVLSGLRILALGIVVLILLNPRLITEIRLTRAGRTLFFVDTSGSMQQRDVYERERGEVLSDLSGLSVAAGPTRAELAQAIIEEQELFDRLGENNEVRLFDFDREVRPVELAEDEAGEAEGSEEAPEAEPAARPVPASSSRSLALQSEGAETALARPFETVLQDSERRPIAAVVVVSDGRSTEGARPEDAARQLGLQRGVPIYMVGVGRSKIPSNYAVQDLEGPRGVEVGFPVEIEGKVVASGLLGPMEVVLERENRKRRRKKIIERRKINVEQPYFEARLKFVDTLEKEGEYRYVLRITESEEETRSRDNERDITVRAAEQNYRLLLLAGNSVPEFRFLRNFTIRDDGIRVSSWQSAADKRAYQDGDVPLRGVPQTPDELEEYDVVVLIDPDPEILSLGFQRALIDFVAEDGGGLAYVASEAYTQRIAREDRFASFRKLLPVRLGRAGGRAPVAGQVYDKAWVPELTPQGAAHPLLRLVDDPQENLRLWSRVVPFYYRHDAGGLAPAAIALLTGLDRAVCAVQQVGLGQSVYLGSDAFWRWRSAGVNYHERFWSAIIRYLATGKKFAGDDKVVVETDRELYRDGDEVRVTLQFSEKQSRQETRLRIPVQLRRTGDLAGVGAAEKKPDASGEGSEEDIELELLPDDTAPGRFVGIYRPETAGVYEIAYEGPAGAKKPEDRDGKSGHGLCEFRVRTITSEWEDPSPDFETLELLASQGRGEFLPLEDIGVLPERIPESSVSEVLGRRATAVWDSALLMIIFCFLVASEWTLRKLWRLN